MKPIDELVLALITKYGSAVPGVQLVELRDMVDHVDKRVVDRSLQRLRKQGKIKFMGRVAGWMRVQDDLVRRDFPTVPTVPVLRAARRDASFYAFHGTAWQYHIMVGNHYVPACNPQGALLTEETAQDAEDVAEGARCRRPGCAVRWPRRAP